METINLAGVSNDSIVDGPGIRTVFFAQGCPHRCLECHNPDTHSFGTGKSYPVLELYKTAKKNPLAKGITFSGGEPFAQAEGFLALARLLKKDNYEIAAYTGYTFEELTTKAQKDLLNEIDILIDGPFILQQRNLDLSFRGSENQRIIDVQKTLAQNKIVLCESLRWVNPSLQY